MQNYYQNYYFPETIEYTNLYNDKNYLNYEQNISNDIPNIFSPLNSFNNINILKLTSLNQEPETSYYAKVSKLNSPITNNISSKSKKKTLVLDLDETLVHSSMKPFPNKKNIILNIFINNVLYTIYAIVRPNVDKFLYEMSLYYELKIFTASLSQYSKPLLDILDKNKVITQVLNRESCHFVNGFYFKDLNLFNKDFKDIIIVDNNPISYAYQKDNGIPISTWIDNPNDNELLKLIPILKYLSNVEDVREVIKNIVNPFDGTLDFLVINTLLKNNNMNYNLQNFDIDKKNILTGNITQNININNNINIISPNNYFHTIKENKTRENNEIKTIKIEEKKTKNNIENTIIDYNINMNSTKNLKITKLNKNKKTSSDKKNTKVNMNKKKLEIPKKEETINTISKTPNSKINSNKKFLFIRKTDIKKNDKENKVNISPNPKNKFTTIKSFINSNNIKNNLFNKAKKENENIKKEEKDIKYFENKNKSNILLFDKKQKDIINQVNLNSKYINRNNKDKLIQNLSQNNNTNSKITNNSSNLIIMNKNIIKNNNIQIKPISTQENLKNNIQEKPNKTKIIFNNMKKNNIYFYPKEEIEPIKKNKLIVMKIIKNKDT